MTQLCVSNFVLASSGAPAQLPNGLLTADTLSVVYSPMVSSAGVRTPDVSTPFNVAVMASLGSVQTLLDSFVSTTGPVTRSISLGSVVYDFFTFVPSFANPNFEIAVEVVNKGGGAAFSADVDLAVVHTA